MIMPGVTMRGHSGTTGGGVILRNGGAVATVAISGTQAGGGASRKGNQFRASTLRLAVLQSTPVTCLRQDGITQMYR